MKKATITASSFKKSFNTQHGELYSHTITFDNGDSGEINAKSEMPDWIQRGQTLYYDSTPNGKYAPKIKRISDKKQIEQFDKANGGSAPQTTNNASNILLELTNTIHKQGEEIERLKSVINQIIKENRLKYTKPESIGKYKQQIINESSPY